LNHRLTDLLDIPRLQAALDSLYASSGIPSAIIDNDGNVHTGSGWQDICTKFHRVHPETRKRCIESDTWIARHIREANPSIAYKCPHGLVDTATPILIEGEHIGNVFTGQLFLEPPDLGHFRAQAKAFGFDEGKYIDAVKKVPIATEKELRENLAFVAHLTGMLAEMGLKRAKEKEAENRLRESEERYRSLFGKGSDGIFIMSSDGKIVEVNESFARMHGYSTEELLQMNIKDLDAPETSKLVPERMRRVLSGETLAIEVEHHHKDGHVFPMEVSANLISIGGEPFVQCFHRDITERKRAEENLKQTIRLRQVLLDAFPCVALLLRPRTREIVASNAAAVKAGAVPGARCYGTWGRREEPCPWCRAPVVWDTGKEQHRIIEDAGTCWDAHWIPVSEDLYMHFAFDITDRKRTEEALLESETRYRSIFNNGADGIVIIDPETATPVDFNQQACAQLGYTREEFANLRISDIDLLEGAGEIKARIRKVTETGYDEFETVHRTKGGDRRNVHVKAQNILADGKSVYHCIWRDITDQKRVEAEKEKLQSQLQQAMKMEAVGRLAGGVAHDFNNLLTVINGYSELLLQKIGKESPMHREVGEIKRAGERAASLTQQLLAFSRKQIIEPRVVRLDLLVADMQAMLPRLIGEDISIQVTTGKSPGSVKVDPGQFQQVLMNLAVNARDSMPDGGKIVIETANVELDESYCASHAYVTPGRYVMLAVSDTGQGMTEEVKARIFEPFFTTKERGSGTGLGLATTYGAVHQAGGTIEVYSEVGIGTTIKIYLPRVEGETASPVHDNRPAVLPGGTETVLVVEDEAIVRTLCVQILARLGYKVLQALNGKEAIAAAQRHGERIDLLLTDVVMPGMNGADLATQLVLHHPEMKVLFTSGYTDDAIVRHGVLDEGVSFIGKPYTPLALARKVREVLDKA
jgi:two-component system cell cycle sensor histidine kinase/response regulator CckA